MTKLSIVSDEPEVWGYELVHEGGGQPDRLIDLGVKTGRDATGFQLHLLGHIKHFDKADSGSAFLEPVVRVHPNLQYRDVRLFRLPDELQLMSLSAVLSDDKPDGLASASLASGYAVSEEPIIVICSCCDHVSHSSIAHGR